MIVIDTNTVSRVFDRENREHDQYAPVLNWILKGKGRMVYGGTTYQEEVPLDRWLKKLPQLFRLLRDKGKLAMIHTETVDDLEERVKVFINDSRCDDPHIIALVIASSCRLVCTDDRRSEEFLKSKSLYREFQARVPKIYKRLEHTAMFNRKEFCDYRLTNEVGR